MESLPGKESAKILKDSRQFGHVQKEHWNVAYFKRGNCTHIFEERKAPSPSLQTTQALSVTLSFTDCTEYCYRTILWLCDESQDADLAVLRETGTVWEQEHRGTGITQVSD